MNIFRDHYDRDALEVMALLVWLYETIPIHNHANHKRLHGQSKLLQKVPLQRKGWKTLHRSMH